MIEELARFLFDRQASSYDATDVERERAWADPGVRTFWIDEASAITAFLKLRADA